MGLRRTSIEARGRTISGKRSTARVALVLTLLFSGVLMVAQPSPVAAAQFASYPGRDAARCGTDGASWCIGGSWLSGRGYGYKNCTDWASWRLQAAFGVPDAKIRGLGHGGWWSGRSTIGDAVAWRNQYGSAQSRGITVNTTPAVGAAAVRRSTSSSYFGHVAVIEAVSGTSITVSEYDGFTGNHTKRTGTLSGLGFNDVVHFERFATKGLPSSPPATPSVAQFAGHLVQWRDEKPNIVTTWLVGPDLKRTWVPDGGTYTWMKAAGARGPTLLSAAQLNALPDRKGVKATTDQLGVAWSAKRGTTVRSVAGGYRLVFQGDGNVVIYNSKNAPLWSSRTSRATNLAMQSDGNLVLYNGTSPVWFSNTAGRGRSRLVMQSDGNLVIYNASGKPTWNTATAGGRNRLAYPAGVRL